MAKVQYLGLTVTDRNYVHKTTEYLFIIEYCAFLSPVVSFINIIILPFLCLQLSEINDILNSVVGLRNTDKTLLEIP
jgi:hypothetical protein